MSRRGNRLTKTQAIRQAELVESGAVFAAALDTYRELHGDAEAFYDLFAHRATDAAARNQSVAAHLASDAVGSFIRSAPSAPHATLTTG